MPFPTKRQLVASSVRVTEPLSVKILREPRSELLKPLWFIAEFCRRNIAQAERSTSSSLERYAEAQPMFMQINQKKGLNMKVITMESSAFTALTEQIAEIAAHVRAVSGGRKEESPDRLLTTREAAHLLNVSCRTLQRMRSEQRIAYVVLRGKCRYRQSEIDRLLEDSTVTGEAATPEQLKRNHTLRTGGRPKGRRT
ncbi:DNA binding domain, excisionase family [Prevotella multiformis DSM 16608]|uniref:DNA binding domain, excisionase family n=7 Tax=Bacteroidota TaxID=976 RepID=F0F865_9BACT|nr:DNA binding domain, excisionase family [Prevotella multiformis DSM 16608]